MKKHLLRLSIIAALTATVSFAETYNFNVPFNFVLQNQTAAAGQYAVDSSAISGAMVIRSANHKMSAVVTGSSMSSASDGSTGKLVFPSLRQPVLSSADLEPGRRRSRTPPNTRRA